MTGSHLWEAAAAPGFRTTPTTRFSITTAEAFFGVRSRVDWRLTIDTPSGSDEGLYTAAVRVRVGDALLTLTGGAAGLRAEGALEITGVATGRSRLSYQRGDRAASALLQHQRLRASSRESLGWRSRTNL